MRSMIFYVNLMVEIAVVTGDYVNDVTCLHCNACLKNVTSGRGEDILFIDGLWQDPEPEDEPCAEYMDSDIHS